MVFSPSLLRLTFETFKMVKHEVAKSIVACNLLRVVCGRRGKEEEGIPAMSHVMQEMLWTRVA